MAATFQPSITITYRIPFSSLDLQLRTNMQKNDLQSNDRCAHLGTGKLSDQNKHILVIRKYFSMKQKVLFTGNVAPNAMEHVSQPRNEHRWSKKIIWLHPSQ